MALPSNTKRKIFDGRYEILSIVGRGADSVVYHARHINGSAQEVALKVLINKKNGASLSDRLRKEALTLVSCRYRYVVRLDDFHSIDDLCYLSMEYAPLGDLAKYVTAKGAPLSVEQAVRFLQQSLEALDFIHATGVVHRDLKPENILVVSEQEIRLADFGLALLPGDEPELEELKRGVGTLAYLPPEALEGIQYDSRSDLYALGLCFYEMITGKHPFTSIPMAEQVEAQRSGSIQPISTLAPSLPTHVADVITTLLAFEAKDRFQTAADALRAIADTSFRATPKAAAPQKVVESVSEQVPQAAPTPSTKSAIVTTSELLGDTEDAEAEEEIELSFEEPANTDQAPPAPSPRATQPTEKLDLDRIKSIVAKDSQRRDNVQQRRSRIEAEAGEPLGVTKQLRRELFPRAPSKVGFGGSGPKQFLTTVLDSLTQLPMPKRVAVVAGVSAILTVALISIFSGSGNKQPRAKQPRPTTQEQAPAPAAAEVSAESPNSFFQSLPEGRYVGTLKGLLPEQLTPVLLISTPQTHELVLILGVDGWIPATTTVVEEDGSFVDAPTFRSNGIILRFNGELSAGQITGTFTDMVTGETGVWNAKLAS
jgi:serine/threonine protein kinase